MLKRILLSVGALVVCASLGSGQTGVGQIQGTVTDSTGAVVPGAAVTVENVNTSNRFQTKASEAGFFVFPSLISGEYKLTVSAAGMQKWEGTITLQAGQRAAVNPSLQVAAAAEQITVVGDVTPLLTTTAPTRATVVERERIEQLPLNGRSVQNLLTITVPGLEGGANQPKVYGLRDSAMELLQDGVNIQDRNTGAIQSRPPGLDTIEEFRVETSVSSAKLNRPASAIFITRAGTNTLHGSIFLTGRNNGFGVARRREENFTKAPPLVRNEFGASVGGPAVIPGVYDGAGKTFFFAAWEEFRLRQSATTGSAVWTEPMRVGNFAGLRTASGLPVTLYDPWSVGPGPTYTKIPYTNNQLPLSRLSPLAKYVFGVTPLPTDPNINPLAAQNYFGPAPTNINQRTLTFRGDHRLSDNDLVFARYSKGQNDQMNRRGFATGGFPITSDNLWNRETYYEGSHTAVGSWTHTFSPTLFVETVGTVGLIDWQYSLNQPSAQQDISAMFKTPNPFKVNGAPVINNAGYQGISLSGILPRSQYTKVYSIEQNYTWVQRTHQFEFGGRYRDEILDTLPDAPNQSTLDFASFATSIYNPATGTSWGAVNQTGDNAANFFLGVASSYAQSRRPSYFNMKGKDISMYFQDNWKVRPNLTINMGLRYSYLGPYLDKAGMTAGFDIASKSIVRTVTNQQLIDTGYTTGPIVQGYANVGVKWTTPDKVGLPNNLVDASLRDFAPRLGFAYTPRVGSKNFVVRGGYGMYYFPIPARTFSELRLMAPLQGSYNYSWNSSAQSPDLQSNYFLRFAPTVIAGVNSENVLDPTQIPVYSPGIQVTALAPKLPTSRAHQWNFTLEHEVLKDTVVRAGLIGTGGRNIEMMHVYNGNPISNYVWFVNSGEALPQGVFSGTARRAIDKTVYGDIRVYDKIGYSNYFGLQLEAERRFSRGLALQFFYLMSNSASTGATPSQGGDFTVNSDTTPERFLRGAFPDDVDARYRLYRYSRDTDIPKHRMRWNWLYDLPVGKGKRFLSNAGPISNRILGGWQIAGYGSANSRYFTLPVANWGAMATPEIYGKKYKVTDCRSGGCFEGYFYYNGYITARQVNVPNGVTGLPQGYTPAQKPINPAPATGTVDANFNDTNNVFVRLNNGTNQLVSVDTGLHPWRNQPVMALWTNVWNGSVYKIIPITERVMFRLNVDAFNLFNQPGLGGPGGDGIISLRTSAQGARVLQYTGRITW